MRFAQVAQKGETCENVIWNKVLIFSNMCEMTFAQVLHREAMNRWTLLEKGDVSAFSLLLAGGRGERSNVKGGGWRKWLGDKKLPRPSV